MPPPDKKFIRNAFDSITPRYDLLNQILSFGMSEAWRKKACEIILDEKETGPASESGPVPKTILDLGCGTGKFLECFLRRREQQVPASVPGAQGPGLQKKTWENAVGLDFSSVMLKKARETVQENALWIQADFDDPPFLESSFDLVISAFTLRSVQDLPAFLKKVHYILAPGGRAAFLDLTRPPDLLARIVFYPYLKFFLPLIGGLITGNLAAYRFLSRSVEHFLSPGKTMELMAAAGFKDCRRKAFSFGVATLMIGHKQPIAHSF